MNTITRKLRRHQYRISADVRFLLRVLLSLLLLQQLMRAIVIVTFPKDLIAVDIVTLIKAIYLGTRFDVMISAWICTPMVFAMLFPSGLRSRSFWRAWVAVMSLFTIIGGLISLALYTTTYGTESYLFYKWLAEGKNIPWHNLWASWVGFIWLFVILILFGLIHELIRAADKSCRQRGREKYGKRLLTFFALLIITVICVRGTLKSGAPLKPERMDFSNDAYANLIATNSSYNLIRTRLRIIKSEAKK